MKDSPSRSSVGHMGLSGNLKVTRQKPSRISTQIRFEAATHEALKETATELQVGVNWLVNKLVEEGLAKMDLTNFRLTRPARLPQPIAADPTAQSGEGQS